MNDYVSECKLDCFGMAVCVIAACQALQLNDVHLALSEDHAWAVFGDSENRDSVEITWHGNVCPNVYVIVASSVVRFLFLTLVYRGLLSQLLCSFTYGAIPVSYTHLTLPTKRIV